VTPSGKKRPGTAHVADWLAIGRVHSTNPARRTVRLRLFDRPAAPVDQLNPMIFRKDGELIRCRVAAVHPSGDVEVAAGVPRDTIAGLKGAEVVVPAETLPSGDTRWHVTEWTGFAVQDAAGVRVGTIAEVIEGPANDTFRLETPDGRTLLVPAIPEVVHEVDPEAGIIVAGDIGPYAVE